MSINFFRGCMFAVTLCSSSLSIADVSLSQLKDMRASFLDFYSPQAVEKGIDLQINITPGPFATIFTSHELQRKNGKVIRSVDIVSGITKVSNFTQDSLAIAVCSELGHIFGGLPYFNRSEGFYNPMFDRERPDNISVEGQADYFVFAGGCFDSYAETSLEYKSSLDSFETQEVKKLCASSSSKNCMRAFSALKDYVAVLQKLDEMSHETDYIDLNIFSKSEKVETVTRKTPMYYPEADCRMETLRNSVLGFERPSCWYVQ